MTAAPARLYVDDTTTLDQGRVRLGASLLYDPGRTHTKQRSTDLYVGNVWYALPSITPLVATGASPDLFRDVTVFDVDADVVEAAVELSRSTTSGSLALDQAFRDALGQSVRASQPQFESWSIRPEAVVLASNPSNGVATGDTTNGLHFDDQTRGPDCLRVGVNLGPLDRYVYYVPTPRDTIPGAERCTEDGDGYHNLPAADLRPIAVQLRPSQGWTMPTTRYLHDGRRAAPTGLSRFLLCSAEKR